MTQNPPIKHVRTSMLDIAYEEHGPSNTEVVILLHGFPYDPRGYDEVAPALCAHGYRVIVPYLRGYGPTRFVSPQVMRSGQQAALAQDLLELMDGLSIQHAALAGYDWGGRAACIVAALWPQRAQHRRLIKIADFFPSTTSVGCCLGSDTTSPRKRPMQR